MIENYRSRIETLHAALEQHFNSLSIGGHPEELYEPVNYLMGIGGKRIRPLFVLLAYSLYKEEYEKILTPAFAVEMFHNFTLMHDDIMDDAPLRRGQASVHEKWDRNTAILSGDVMLVKVYDMLLEVPGDKLALCLKYFNRTAAEVCEGQQLDMNFESRKEVTEAEYLNMIRLKTAVLLGFSLFFGAVLADAPLEEAQKLYDFGVNIGIGFQLKDDLLDVYAENSKFGKQVGGDIISNKKTYLLIKARELAQGEEAEGLAYWAESQNFDKTEKVQAVTSLYNAMGIKTITEAKMEAYFEQGFRQLSLLKHVNQDVAEALDFFARELVNREH